MTICVQQIAFDNPTISEVVEALECFKKMYGDIPVQSFGVGDQTSGEGIAISNCNGRYLLVCSKY